MRIIVKMPNPASWKDSIKDKGRELRTLLRSRAVVLMYHRVNDNPGDVLGISVSPRHFEEHLEVLRRKHLVVSTSELFSALRTASFSQPVVAITFDDGYFDNLAHAAPLLSRYDLPATFFLASGYLDGRREFWWDELPRIITESKVSPCSWDLSIGVSRIDLSGTANSSEAWILLRELFTGLDRPRREELLDQISVQAGVARTIRPPHRPMNQTEAQRLAGSPRFEIGSHTVNHIWLSAHPPATQQRELTESKTALEQITGKPVRSLSYPYGKRTSASRDTIRLAREAGYWFGFANVRGQLFIDSPPEWIPRMIPGNVDGDGFSKQLSDFFHYHSNLRIPSATEIRPPTAKEIGMTKEASSERTPERTSENPPTTPSLLSRLVQRVLGVLRLRPAARRKRKRSIRLPILTPIASRIRLPLGIRPLSVIAGADRGQPLHRHYLEQFLLEHSGDVRGDCLEFQNDQYTSRYGQRNVTSVSILHKEGSGKSKHATIIADLCVQNQVPSEAFDCIICTHTLHVVEDPFRFMDELFRLLRPGGVLLMGSPFLQGIHPDWPELWRFTPDGLRLLAQRRFSPDQVDIRIFGNSLTAAGDIRGLSKEDFLEVELAPIQKHAPVEICLRARKS